ncbi:MAG: S9 family peptidase [Candidatus Kariarchaeaceae archaeon]|jgi:acetyl esterase/lipase
MVDKSINLDFIPRTDWKTSEHVENISLFKHSSIEKVVGHPNRHDFIYMSDEPGYYALHRFDPNTGKGENIMVINEPFTDHLLFTNFLLHPSKPWVIYTEDKIGDQNHSLILLDYEENNARKIVNRVGSINMLYHYKDDLIAVVQKKECNVILRIDYNGNIVEIYRNELQIMSATVSIEHNYVVASLGRGSTKLAVINIENQNVVHWISETEDSDEHRPAINDEMGYLAYVTNAKGNVNELVILQLDTWKEILRMEIPGFVGYFICDIDYIHWVNNTEILLVVCKDAQSSPRVLNLEGKKWSEPLSNFTVPGFLGKVKDGIYWPASSFSRTSFVEAYRNGIVETILPPAFENPDLHIENHWYTSYDGLKVQGWLIRNPNNPTAPLIVQCHGGPTYATFNDWDPFTQILVNAGYHVFQPNFRGSTTFGPDFQALNAGDMGGGDVQDVVFAAKYATELLNLQTKPILTGGSYGGYLTLQCSGKHPEIWAGGIARVPLADLAGEWEHANAHYRQFLTHFLGGTYEEKSELYHERSPITHLEHLKSPVLILAGKNDPNAYFEPTQNFYDKARNMQKPVSMIVSEGGHGSKSSEETMEKLVHMIDFLKTKVSH